MNYILKYLKTILIHKKYVFDECRVCGIFWQGATHDLSKFSKEEFLSSAKYFCGDRSPHYQDAEENGYSSAWLHHKGCNKHHWEYWTDFYEDTGEVKINKIPYKYVVEMVCDWIGAGKAYSKDKWTKDSPLEYYNKVRSGRHFHPDTEELILKFLKCIKNNGLEEFHKMARDKYLKAEYEEEF